MKRIKEIVAVAAFLAVGVLGCGQFAHAEGKAGKETVRLSPVVVNAEKRSEEAQKVPAGLTVFETSDILNLDIKGTRDLSEHVPNMEFKDFGSRRHGLLFMRGIKSLPGGQAGTGFSLDGLSYSKAYMFMGLPMFDIDRIEVLRGAQGTLYGRNTTGGVVNIYTAEPGDEFESRVSAAFGSYGTKELRANASGPLVEDTLYLGVSGLVSGSGSYVENDFSNGEDEGRHKSGKAGRIKLRYEPSDALKTTLSVNGQYHDDGSFPLRRTARNGLVRAGALPADSRYHYSHDAESTEKVTSVSVNLNTEIETPIGTLQSVTGFQHFNCDESIDADMSPFDMMVKEQVIHDDDWSQEFRLTSPEDDGPFRWIAGVYMFHFDGGSEITNNYGAAHPVLAGQKDDFDTDLENTGVALFGEGTYTFFSKLDLTLGLRGEYEHTEGRAEAVRTNVLGVSNRTAFYDESENYTTLLPKLSLGWHFNDDVMAYGSVAKAHKVGGYNAAVAPAGSEGYGEEKSWLYEVGVKSYLLDRRLMLNLSAFYTSIEDEQLPLFVVGTTQGYLANAGESHRAGLELESRFRLSEAWTLNGSAAWIEAKFDDYEDVANGIDYSGERVFCVPQYTFNVGLDYNDKVTEDVGLFGHLGVTGTGPQYFDNANTVKQAAYELFNARFGVQYKSVECSLWAKNIFDRHYVAFENTTAGFAEDGRPRTLGASLTYSF